MLKISELLKIYKENEVDSFLKSFCGLSLNESNLSYSDIKENWKFLGDNSSNGSSINMLGNGEKGLIERITNAVDSVIEKQFIGHNLQSANKLDVVLERAFPKFYEMKQDVLNGSAEQLSIKDAYEQVILAVNDGSKSNKPTFDIIDKGTGIEGKNFSSTILSISKGNKLSSDKNYLIGAFGQGGSTSLPFAYATIIISKYEGKFFFTLIKAVELNDYKNMAYVYLVNNGDIIEVDNDYENGDDYLSSFMYSDSGTLVRMVETDISKRFRDNEVTKPGMLGDYINTQMFSVGFPVKIMDLRKDYVINEKTQNRYSYGSYLKMQTSKYIKRDYCGRINIEHKNRSYNIDYFVLLPYDELDWGKDSVCKNVFEQFNVSLDPIIYTVNGQTINTEKYIKINNAGLSFLRFRLLVIINLDVLGKEKYKFFTSNRDQIKDTDLTRGFIDKVINALSNVDKLKQINEIIAEKSISSDVDQDLLKDISDKVKNQYNRYLKNGDVFPSGWKNGFHYEQEDEEIFGDDITELDITSEKFGFFKNESIKFTVTTHAKKHINAETMVYMYVDGKSCTLFQKNSMNGRIQFLIPGNRISCGKHSIYFAMYEPKQLSGREFNFEVFQKDAPITDNKEVTKSLDVKISMIDEATLICNISKNFVDKEIQVALCLNTDELSSEVYGNSASADQISSIKKNLIGPVALFGLYLGDYYDRIQADEDKNKIMLSFIKSIVFSDIKKDII